MTIKFHTTAQKNNINLFLPEPENLVGSTKQRSNTTDHNTAIKKGTKSDIQNTEIKVGNWIKAAIISNKNSPTVSEMSSAGISKDPELKKNILTNHSSSPMNIWTWFHLKPLLLLHEQYDLLATKILLFLKKV